MPALKVGQSYVAAVTSSDPSQPVPGASLAATVDNPSVASSTPDGAGNVLVRAVGPGTAVVTYSAPGFIPATEALTVVALPSLVVTDGPIQG